MALVRERISDGRVLGLLEQFPGQGVPEEGVEVAPEKGSPQGGVICRILLGWIQSGHVAALHSPLLANIYLNPLDWLMTGLGFKSVRYADDIVVLARSAEAAAEALGQLRDWIGRAGLTLHPDKTRLVDRTASRAHFELPASFGRQSGWLSRFARLPGYRFQRTARGKVIRLARPKSMKKLRESLREPTRRANGRSLEAIIAILNPKLRGWFAYFRQAHISEHRQMDRWVRVRLRSIPRKRHKGQGRGRGLDHFKWPNRYFENLGLFSLERAREEQMSLRRGANC